MENTPKRHSLYHGPLDGNDNIESQAHPLIVNCAGIVENASGLRPSRPCGRDDYYILLMVRGELRVELPGGIRFLRPGDLICYHPRTPYRYTSEGMIQYYWIHFTGSDAPDLVRECGLTNHKILHTDHPDRLIAGFERIFRDFVTQDPLLLRFSAMHLTQLCLDLARLSGTAGPPEDCDDRIDRVIARIHRCYHQELSIASLAGDEFLSEGRLRELFHRRTGMSPHAYLTALRIQTARQLLETTDITASEAGAAVGYTDPLYFSRIFKKTVGIPPSRYRSLVRTKTDTD